MYGLPFPDTPGYVNGPSNVFPSPRHERGTQTGPVAHAVVGERVLVEAGMGFGLHHTEATVRRTVLLDHHEQVLGVVLVAIGERAAGAEEDVVPVTRMEGVVADEPVRGGF